MAHSTPEMNQTFADVIVAGEALAAFGYTSSRTKYPGYRSAYTSTSQWPRPPAGPYVCITYTPPDEQGMSVRRESFHWTLDDAKKAAEA